MRLLIVGGVAGGASAATRARRLSNDAEIVMFDRGKYPSYAVCGLAYYIGGEIEERDDLLVVTPDLLRNRFAIDVRMRSEVRRILRDSREIEVENLDTGETCRERYDKLILAPGAAPVEVPGYEIEGVFTLRDIPQADRIKDYIARTQAKRSVVVGGGYIGVEMAENLRRMGLDVSVVHSHEYLMRPLDPEMAVLLHQEMKLNGVKLFLGAKADSFSRDDSGIHVRLSSGRTLDCDLAMLCIGVRPTVDLARDAGLTIGKRGGIVVDEHMVASDPNIYAVGDAIEVVDFVTGENTLVPLGGPANRQGRIAADHIFGRDSAYRKTQGTAIVRAFGLAVAATGCTEKVLKERGIAYEKCYVHAASHAGYYPGGSSMAMKLIFSTTDGRILGAQIIGGDGVDKRIDVLATAMRAGMTVFDLEHLELAYAPQYGSAKDPINMLGFVASNILRGDMKVAHWHDVDDLKRKGAVFLDVRTKDEFELGHISDAMHIPVDDLRNRISDVPKDRPLVVYCGSGLRAYNACRALMLSGFADVRNLTGGWHTYEPTLEKESPSPKEEAMATPKQEKSPASEEVQAAVRVDACGLQCPGPIVKLNKKAKDLDAGAVLEISATDPGFATDLPAWCERTGHEFLSIERDGAKLIGRIRKPAAEAKPAPTAGAAAEKNDKTIVVFSNDLDRVMASFIIANGAAAMGRKVTMFFTFWGLNVLRKDRAADVEKGLVDRMFGWMMPRGAKKLKLSKMNMAGMGTAMMKRVMKQKNVQSLPDLIALAMEQGVRLVACTMTMDIMGIKREELIGGIEEGGVATYLAHAETSDVNLFI
ncbi:MAG: DsrE/DsrF/DrsH-like family protein [Planctomycetota bacterium]